MRFAVVASSTKKSLIQDKDIERYGITLEKFDRLISEQDGRCGICQELESNLARRLGIDHNHKTSRVRGLLCNHCNLILGKAEKSGIYTQAQLDYLADAEDRADWLY